MSWRYVVSVIIGFLATIFGVQWLGGRFRRDKRGGSDRADRERATISESERLGADAVSRNLSDELVELSPRPIELGHGDFAEWFNVAGRASGSGPAGDTDEPEQGD